MPMAICQHEDNLPLKESKRVVSVGDYYLRLLLEEGDDEEYSGIKRS